MAKRIIGLAPTAVAFRNELFGRLADAERAGSVALDVNSGDLHRAVGNYPGAAHRMPNCCAVMGAAMQAGDEIVLTPPKGRGATLTIRYKFPRSKLRNGPFAAAEFPETSDHTPTPDISLRLPTSGRCRR